MGDWVEEKAHEKNIEDDIPQVAETSQELTKDKMPNKTNPLEPEAVLEDMEEQ